MSPVVAVQYEYSLWRRKVEGELGKSISLPRTTFAAITRATLVEIWTRTAIASPR
jgi:hypothetical protein